MRPPHGDRGFRGRGRGRGRGGRFGGHGREFHDKGPTAASAFMHTCEGDAVAKLANEKVPFFNAPIYLQNKTQIGKVNEIFGPINDYYFFIKMVEGIIATSYAKGGKFYIDPAKLLPLTRFLPQTKGMHKLQQDVAGGRGGGFHGRGAPRGGRDRPPRGGGRGGFRGWGRSYDHM